MSLNGRPGGFYFVAFSPENRDLRTTSGGGASRKERPYADDHQP